MTDLHREVHELLRERLRPGARYDALEAPSQELTWARRGTAYFARKVKELSDVDLDAASLIAGWSRRHVVAHVSYQARTLARLVASARCEAVGKISEEPDAQIDNVTFGATLPAHALRYLFKHSEVHLNVEWRDLPAAGWNAHVQTPNGQLLCIRDTPFLRAREVWLRAIDLGNYGSALDIPGDFRVELQTRGEQIR